MSVTLQNVVDLAVEHAYREEPCGPTRVDGTPDHYVETCKAGCTANGDRHTFDHAQHVRDLLSEALQAANTRIGEAMTPGERETVDEYRERVGQEVEAAFDAIGGGTW